LEDYAGEEGCGGLQRELEDYCEVDVVENYIGVTGSGELHWCKGKWRIYMGYREV
jgi:hypothetical protein